MRLSSFLIGAGFFWMAAWSVVGSLLGARINTIAISADTTWLQSWERTLLRTAHAHMNTMAITLILMGLCLPRALRYANRRHINRACVAAVASTPVFGVGLLLEAYHPPLPGQPFWGTGVTALGGIVYLLALGYWGSLFLFAALRRA